MYNIIYSNQAQVDLEDAISHIAKDSVTNALNYLTDYEEKIELLRLNPYMGVECKNKLIQRDCRVLVYRSHIIIYKVDTTIDEIFIIRIYHGSVDYANKENKTDKN
jgi:plasmid stabilization system protein ParE